MVGRQRQGVVVYVKSLQQSTCHDGGVLIMFWIETKLKRAREASHTVSVHYVSSDAFHLHFLTCARSLIFVQSDCHTS